MSNGGFGRGYEIGQAQSGENPVTMIIKGTRDAYARRRSEDKKRDEEEQTLLHTLIQLGAKHEYDVKLKQEEGRMEDERVGNILRQLRIGGKQEGEEEVSEDLTSRIPAGVSLKAGPLTITGQQTPAQIGEEKATAEAFQRAEGIKRATRRLGSIVNQFNKALPQEQRGPTTVSQRISGFFAGLGARTGFRPNPELLALQDTAKLQLRAILRDMGEGARMSDQDIKQNLAVIEQAGLSNEERKAKIRSFMQVAIDSMDTPILDNLKKDKATVNMLGDFGVTLPLPEGEEDEDTNYQQFLKAIGQ